MTIQDRVEEKLPKGWMLVEYWTPQDVPKAPCIMFPQNREVGLVISFLKSILHWICLESSLPRVVEIRCISFSLIMQKADVLDTKFSKLFQQRSRELLLDQQVVCQRSCSINICLFYHCKGHVLGEFQCVGHLVVKLNGQLLWCTGCRIHKPSAIDASNHLETANVSLLPLLSFSFWATAPFDWPWLPCVLTRWVTGILIKCTN